MEPQPKAARKPNINISLLTDVYPRETARRAGWAARRAAANPGWNARVPKKTIGLAGGPSQPRPPMPPLLVIDPATIENLRALSPDDNGEFLREIIGIFLADTPLRITELTDSQLAGDVPKFTRAAHSIKGSAANLGAVALGAVAQTLESESKEKPLGDLSPLIGTLQAEYARAQGELEKLAR
jgi:HPt (histidine-containing phosphotransfer) domain-containing protein